MSQGDRKRTSSLEYSLYEPTRSFLRENSERIRNSFIGGWPISSKLPDDSYLKDVFEKATELGSEEMQTGYLPTPDPGMYVRIEAGTIIHGTKIVIKTGAIFIAFIIAVVSVSSLSLLLLLGGVSAADLIHTVYTSWEKIRDENEKRVFETLFYCQAKLCTEYAKMVFVGKGYENGLEYTRPTIDMIEEEMEVVVNNKEMMKAMGLVGKMGHMPNRDEIEKSLWSLEARKIVYEKGDRWGITF